MIKFGNRKEGEINKLIVFILFCSGEFWKDSRDMPQRYEIFNNENKEKVADVFKDVYLQHYGIGMFDAIAICHQVGFENKVEFIRNFNLITN